LGYARVESEFLGKGDPGVLLGVTYDLLPSLTVAATYRSEIVVDFSGESDMLLRTNPALAELFDALGGLPIGAASTIIGLVPGVGDLLSLDPSDDVDSFATRIASDIASETQFAIPKAIEVGMAWEVNPKWLVAVDFRRQYHSESPANQRINVTLTDPLFSSLRPLGQSIGWRDVDAWNFGVEYLYSGNLKLRAGFNFGNSATTKAFNHPIGTPFAERQGSVGGGFGYTNGQWQYDFAFTYAAIEFEIPQTFDENGDVVFPDNCQPGQLTKTGCPGRTTTTNLSLGFSAGKRF